MKKLKTIDLEKQIKQLQAEKKKLFEDCVAVVQGKLSRVQFCKENNIAYKASYGLYSDPDKQLQAENERLKGCIDEIEAVSCGEEQVAEDDSEGMGWIYKRIQTLKGGE